MNFKFSVVHFLVFLCGLVLGTRLLFVQVIGSDRLDDKIASQFATRVIIKARRGDILDKKGHLIATSVLSRSAFIDPEIEKLSPYKIKKISKIVGLDYEKLSKRLKRKTRFVWLKRKLKKNTYENLKALDLKGLGFIDEYKRIYPYKKSLKFLVGNVDIDGKGISGLELEYDQILAGKNIRKKALRDGKGRWLLFSDYELYDDLKGKDVTLSLEIESQVFLTESLKKQLKKVDAKRAWAATMDLRTGEIIAQSQVHSKDSKISNRNILTSEVYEQGSIIKTFSFLKAMKDLKMKPSDEVLCYDDGFKIGRRTIKNSHEYDCEKMSLVQSFSKSLNTVSADLALKVGEDELLKYYRFLGFGSKTNVDFPGEAAPLFQKKLSGPHQLASLSFGHGLALSSVQVMKAYAKLFNEDKNFKPRYKALSLKKNTNIKDNYLTKGLLSSVVSESGTAPLANVDYYLVGGKTGTAQKPDLINGGYSKEVLSTFIGVYPLVKPRYITLVSFDEPQKLRSGGAVSAPVFSEYAGFLLRSKQVVPDKLSPKNINKFKNLLSSKSDKKKNLYVKGTVPDLKGLSLRETISLLKKHNIKMDYEGSGKVFESVPRPGESLPVDRKVYLAFKP